MINIIKKINYWYVLLGFAVTFGIILRLYGLNRSGIFFYDEALYLNHSLPILELIEKVHPAGQAFWQAMAAYIKAPLAFTKPVWILLVDSRFLFTQVHDWDYAKYVSCVFGILTLPIAFIFSRRYFNSLPVACFSTALLALLPGHIFYSRIGLQEAFSIFVVLTGFYYYLFPRDFGKKTFLAGLFLCLGYLANYRLIVLPMLVIVTEMWFGLVCKEGIRWRHMIFTCLTFAGIMIFVGSLMDASNGRFVLAWVMHQGDMAPAKRMWSEVFAYPYYLFRMENWVLAGAFFASVYFIFKRELRLAWPLVICLAQMLLFTTATDRGARYIAVVLPFMTMGVAVLFYRLYQDFSMAWQKNVVVILAVVMFAGMVVKAVPLARASSDYRSSSAYLLTKDPSVKFLSSQENVQKLYFMDRTRVRPVADNVMSLAKQYSQGYRYLVLDPQAYISFSSSEYKWGLPLKDYLGYVDKNVKPIRCSLTLTEPLWRGSSLSTAIICSNPFNFWIPLILSGCHHYASMILIHCCQCCQLLSRGRKQRFPEIFHEVLCSSVISG